MTWAAPVSTVIGNAHRTRGIRTIATRGLEATPDHVPPSIQALPAERMRAALRAHEHGPKNVRGENLRISAHKNEPHVDWG